MIADDNSKYQIKEEKENISQDNYMLSYDAYSF